MSIYWGVFAVVFHPHRAEDPPSAPIFCACNPLRLTLAMGQVTMDELENEDKLERLRTAVVVKTYSKLVHLYKLKPSVETEARMLKRVKAFSRALFKNMSWNGEHASRCGRPAPLRIPKYLGAVGRTAPRGKPAAMIRRPGYLGHTRSVGLSIFKQCCST